MVVLAPNDEPPDSKITIVSTRNAVNMTTFQIIVSATAIQIFKTY